MVRLYTGHYQVSSLLLKLINIPVFSLWSSSYLLMPSQPVSTTIILWQDQYYYLPLQKVSARNKNIQSCIMSDEHTQIRWCEQLIKCKFPQCAPANLETSCLIEICNISRKYRPELNTCNWTDWSKSGERQRNSQKTEKLNFQATEHASLVTVALPRGCLVLVVP
jgi:hypothetical protein